MRKTEKRKKRRIRRRKRGQLSSDTNAKCYFKIIYSKNYRHDVFSDLPFSIARAFVLQQSKMNVKQDSNCTTLKSGPGGMI